MTLHHPTEPVRIGVIGLGRAFTLMLPTFLLDPRVKLVAATDPIDAAKKQFESDFSAPTFGTAEALCAHADVQVVYIASPHQFHAEHVAMAAAHGKHVLVEKPMALTLADCSAMIDACQRAGVHMVVGHSHSFDLPILHTRRLIDSGQYGAVKMIQGFNYTDFLFRPRRPEELDTAAGGGVVFSQAAHQIDIVRLLGGGRVASVRAFTGNWDPTRPTEGAYSALLGFEPPQSAVEQVNRPAGAFASVNYSGYGHFDSDELLGNIGEMGQPKTDADYGTGRRRLAGHPSASQETALKAARNYGGSLYAPPDLAPRDLAHQQFGHWIVSCEKADLQPGPKGVAIYADDAKTFHVLPAPRIPRQEVIDELVAVVSNGKPATHSGEWARATTAVCLALLESAQSGREVKPPFQVGVA